MTINESSTFLVWITCAVKFWLEPLAPCETKQLEYSSCWNVDRASIGKPEPTEARGRKRAVRDPASARNRNIFLFLARTRRKYCVFSNTEHSAVQTYRLVFERADKKRVCKIRGDSLLARIPRCLAVRVLFYFIQEVSDSPTRVIRAPELWQSTMNKLQLPSILKIKQKRKTIISFSENLTFELILNSLDDKYCTLEHNNSL